MKKAGIQPERLDEKSLKGGKPIRKVHSAFFISS
jgi:hypothetical protein